MHCDTGEPSVVFQLELEVNLPLRTANIHMNRGVRFAIQFPSSPILQREPCKLATENAISVFRPRSDKGRERIGVLPGTTQGTV